MGFFVNIRNDSGNLRPVNNHASVQCIWLVCNKIQVSITLKLYWNRCVKVEFVLAGAIPFRLAGYSTRGTCRGYGPYLWTGGFDIDGNGIWKRLRV